jgi:hypothetical protein
MISAHGRATAGLKSENITIQIRMKFLVTLVSYFYRQYELSTILPKRYLSLGLVEILARLSFSSPRKYALVMLSLLLLELKGIVSLTNLTCCQHHLACLSSLQCSLRAQGIV